VKTPILRTARLTLRRPIEADIDAWAALDADVEATRFIGGLRSRAESWQGLATAVGMWSLRGCGLFSVTLTGTGEWVGRVGPWIPEGAIGTEVGWAIAPSAWGRGYAAEAAQAAVGWAFDHLGWTDVIHCIDAANAGSIAVAARLGSRWLRTGREADGTLVQVYGQGRDEWFASSSALRRAPSAS
jgi:RimJ/RimL family protein N-acetyltransferase